jgi:ATP-dependent helicase HepA
MDKLKPGMYIRCPFDQEDPEDPRVFILGQIYHIDESLEIIKVAFHDIEKIHDYYDIPTDLPVDINKISRCKILRDSKVILESGIEGRIICDCKENLDAEGFFNYYVQYKHDGKNIIKVINEKTLKVQFTRADLDPRVQMKNYEFQNPKWYDHRKTVMKSLHILKNATFGFETLVGSRVFLLPHQVDTIIRAIGSDKCRFMLADEVGLGKTIEACVIMKGLKENIGKLRTLIIAPDSLVYQWQNELSIKFWTDVPVWTGNALSTSDNLIVPLEKLTEPEGKSILTKQWDLCIVDETHRLIGMDKEYEIISQLSKKVNHILLLSATPIQQRKIEYLKLLRLLEPERYEIMNEADFSELLDKQKIIRNKVYPMVRDIDDYIEDELCDDYKEDLCYLEEKLNDKVLNKLVNDINVDSEDNGLSSAKLALAYIGNNYQIERKIIRHRRLELNDRMAQRDYIKIDYELVGGEQDFYELDTYDELIKYLEHIQQLEGSSVLKGEFTRIFISAMFSSPWSLKEVLKIRKKALTNLGKRVYDEREIKYTSTPRYERDRFERVITSIAKIKCEEDILDSIEKNCILWEKAMRDELNNLDELYDFPEKIKGRLVKVIDHLAENTDLKKLVVFTSWKETLVVFEEVLKQKFGEDSTVSFYTEMDEETLQESVDKFQGQESCRFIICDELGGEGRNFQIADAVIHLDLPWSPVQLEQRIGRLDRIGRDKNRKVLSLICCSIETVEEDLFNLWNEGLNIFKESLSGLEIALGGIHEQILISLGKDMKYGLNKSLDDIKSYSTQMREVVNEERYFDMSRQLDVAVEEQLTKLIQIFDENEGQNLYSTMLSWTDMAGLGSSELNSHDKIVSFSPKRFSPNAMRNTLFVPPNLEEAHNRSRHRNVMEIKGTFSRRVAVEREDLIFYAPGDPFFESIVNNAEELSRGRACAYSQRSSVNWEGFVLTWSINIDPRHLLAIGEGVENLVIAKGYIPLEQIVTYSPISEEYSHIDISTIKYEVLNRFDIDKISHLGRRKLKYDFLKISERHGISNLEWFKKKYSYKLWNSIINTAYKQGRENAKEILKSTVDIKRFIEDLSDRNNGIEASDLYYGNAIEGHNRERQRIEKINDALFKGVNRPELFLDSISYIMLVNEDE